jgi:hypothetical protein
MKDIFTARVIRQVERIGSRIGSRIFKPSDVEPKTAGEESVDPSESAREMVTMGIVSNSLLHAQEIDSEASIVAFPAPVGVVSKSVPPAAETRGAAALQLFLFVYISPVELSLQLLHCITLENLYSIRV